MLCRKDDVRLHCLGKINFYHGLAISLLLHVSLVLPLLLTTLHTADQSRHERLRIEVFGMVSNRQMEEQHMGTEAPQQGKRPAQQVNNTVPRTSPDKYQTVAAESPVHVQKTDEPVFAQMPVVSDTAGAVVEQRQQTINYEAATVEYAGKVGKRVQTNLVYPKEVREDGLTGVTRIAFTITLSGDIKEGTLRVIKSSGYAALDSSALRSARVSAPFEDPPGGQANVAVNVYFNRDI